MIKRLTILFTALALLLPGAIAADKPAARSKLDIYFFYSPHCGACHSVIKDFLPGIQKKYGDKLAWRMIDISQAGGMGVFLRICEIHGHLRTVTPTLLVGDEVLTGGKDVRDKLDITIEEVLSGKIHTGKRYGWQDFASLNTLMFFFKKITPGTVLLTGLVDGVNPCAFAVIAFFLSFLVIYGYKRREIFLVGVAYCLAVFAVYVLLGLGLFEAIYHFSGFPFVRRVFYYLISLFCLGMFALAVYDYVRFRKSGFGEAALLKLPAFLQTNIPLPGGRALSENRARGIWGLLGTAFVVGACVALLEGACTAPLYFPAISLIIQNINMRLQAVGYLLLYNLVFILPLAVVFVLTLWGAGSPKFKNFIKARLGVFKIAMAVAFLAMGVVLLFLA